MFIYLIVGLIIGIVGTAVTFLVQKRFFNENMRNVFSLLSREALRENTEEFLELAKQKLEIEQTKAVGELDRRKDVIHQTVENLNKRLGEYEALVREFEKDRGMKYGSIEQQMRSATETTDRLKQTTDRLTAILGNVKLRGQWGERMAEDILRYSGLEENIHYLKNKAQETKSTRPDYTFLLPDGHKVNMDVKFPLNNYLLLRNTENENEQKRLTQEFLKDVKGRIKEIQTRDYINSEEQTLGYVLLFIPNEQVYAFIHDIDPRLMDACLQQKIILCSPFTLYAVLSVIRQAFDNFYFTEATQEILKVVNAFVQSYEKFQTQFEKLGKQLGEAQKVYSRITTTSYRMMESKIRNIENCRKGEKMELDDTDEQNEEQTDAAEET